MLMAEGALPFLWLPVWLYFISDHPRDAKWISREEKDFLETTLQREAGELEPAKKISLGRAFLQPAVFVMLAVCFLYNSASYGCNTFLTEGLRAAATISPACKPACCLPYLTWSPPLSWCSSRGIRTGRASDAVTLLLFMP